MTILRFAHQFISLFSLANSINFWLFSVIIKLLPCLVLTVISFILIRVLCQAAKRKVKLKGYNQAASTSNINTVLNGHRYLITKLNYVFICICSIDSFWSLTVKLIKERCLRACTTENDAWSHFEREFNRTDNLIGGIMKFDELSYFPWYTVLFLVANFLIRLLIFPFVYMQFSSKDHQSANDVPIEQQCSWSPC